MDLGSVSLHIVVSFYEKPDLVDSACANLLERSDEIRDIQGVLFLVNDSPSNDEVTRRLRTWEERLKAKLPVHVEINPSNLGFVQSMNRVMARSAEQGAHVLLLNSDVLLAKGAVGELLRVADLDPMIGFVNPRSNNATLCSLPVERPGSGEVSFERAWAAYQELSPRLPDWQFIPTGVGFCLLIKNQILREFGFFDEIYGLGYNEENDLCLRANRCGFRVALANRAFAYHLGSVSFSAERRSELDRRNREVLLGRYPEYPRAVAGYFESPEYGFEKMLSKRLEGKAAGKLEVVLDLASLQKYNNGTTECAKGILRSLTSVAAGNFKLFAVCDARVAAYHRLGELFPGLEILPIDTGRFFDIALRIGQPFALTDLLRVSRLGVYNIYMILDSIAWDCQYLRYEDIDALWRVLADVADGLLFNSQFTQDQFVRRFSAAANLPRKTCLHSLDARDYPQWAAAARPGQAYVLLVGNKYEHKFLRPTLTRLLETFPDLQFKVFGLNDVKHERVQGYASGYLEGAELERLVGEADAIVYPSMYEGFGLPIVHGLSAGKVVFARDSSLNHELLAGWTGPGQLELYSDTAALETALKNFVSGRLKPNARPARTAWSWESGGALLNEFFRTVVSNDLPLARGQRRLEVLYRLEAVTRVDSRRSFNPIQSSRVLSHLNDVVKRYPLVHGFIKKTVREGAKRLRRV